MQENDPDQQISCVISDWRLFKNGSNNLWQDIQGYEVLSEISTFHMASLVSLTSEIDSNVHAIRNLLGINITLFKKQHLQLSDGNLKLWDMFADSIEDLCLQSINLVGSQPTGSNWTSENSKNKNISLRTKYLLKRRANWFSFQNSISIKADQCWNYYKNALAYSNPYLLSIEKQFGLSLGDSLENTLVVRRIWLALWFQNDKIRFIGRIMAEEVPEINIYIILKGVDLDDERRTEDTLILKESARVPKDSSPYIASWKKKLENNATVFCNALCIKTSNLPGEGILPEEKSWFLKHSILIDRNIIEYED